MSCYFMQKLSSCYQQGGNGATKFVAAYWLRKFTQFCWCFQPIKFHLLENYPHWESYCMVLYDGAYGYLVANKNIWGVVTKNGARFVFTLSLLSKYCSCCSGTLQEKKREKVLSREMSPKVEGHISFWGFEAVYTWKSKNAHTHANAWIHLQKHTFGRNLNNLLVFWHKAVKPKA